MVLSRKPNEEIWLSGGTIRIAVVDIRGDRVRIGITAPKEVDVHRREVAEAIARQAAAERDRQQREETGEGGEPCSNS